MRTITITGVSRNGGNTIEIEPHKYGEIEIVLSNDLTDKPTQILINYLDSYGLCDWQEYNKFTKAIERAKINKRRREIRHDKKLIDEAEAKGEEIVRLSWYYGEANGGRYPRALATMDNEGRWIKTEDALITLENEVINKKNPPRNTKITEDSNGLYTKDWKRVNTLSGIKELHQYRKPSICYIKEYGLCSQEYADSIGYEKCVKCGRMRRDKCICESYELNRYHEEHDMALFANDEAKRATRKIGIEFEKTQLLNAQEIIEAKTNLWRCERDGTCTAEYITPILPFDEISQPMSWIMQKGKNILNATIGDNCGGHIHISIEGKTPNQVYEMIQGWRPLLWALYPTRLSGYSNRYAYKDDHSVDVGVRNETIEVRIFPGCIGKNQLLFRLSLLKFMLDHPTSNAQEAVRIINNSDDFCNILLIAYGDNTPRLRKLIERIQSFYGEDTTTPTPEVHRISQRMIHDKEIGKSYGELQILDSLPINV